jgi:hypothetical protein
MILRLEDIRWLAWAKVAVPLDGLGERDQHRAGDLPPGVLPSASSGGGQFLADGAHSIGRLDAEANPVAADAQNRDVDVAVEEEALVDLVAEDQHGL